MDPTGGAKRTLIEEGTSFKGALSSECPVVVRGRVEGEVDTPALSVSATGSVHGKAKVGEVDSEGELSGEFDADTVRLSGVVKDNTVIRAKTLEVKLSSSNGQMQVIFGECQLEVGEAPSEEAEMGKRKGKKRDARPSEAPPPDDGAA